MFFIICQSKGYDVYECIMGVVIPFFTLSNKLFAMTFSGLGQKFSTLRPQLFFEVYSQVSFSFYSCGAWTFPPLFLLSANHILQCILGWRPIWTLENCTSSLHWRQQRFRQFGMGLRLDHHTWIQKARGGQLWLIGLFNSAIAFPVQFRYPLISFLDGVLKMTS